MTPLSRALFTGRFALLASMVLVLAACTSYPLGMSKEEWVLLAPEQQMAARLKQADLNRANAERRAEQAAARRQRYAAMEAAERRRIEELYRSSRYGDVLECVVEGGIAEFRRGRHAYTPVPFTLARGEVKSVTLRAGDRNGKFWARYSPDGLSMNLCYRKPQGNGGRYCVSVNGQSQDFSAGITRQVSVQRVFRDARVICAHRPERDMPLIYVQRHDPQVYRIIHNHHYRSRARRTPTVIHNHYSRPAPPPPTKTVIRKTVIHKHYHQAPAARPAPKEIHKRHHQAPVRLRAHRPNRVEPHETEATRRASPGTKAPPHTRSHRVTTPRSTVHKAKNRSAQRQKQGRQKRVKKDEHDEETLTSAPGRGKKHGHGKSTAD